MIDLVSETPTLIGVLVFLSGILTGLCIAGFVEVDSTVPTRRLVRKVRERRMATPVGRLSKNQRYQWFGDKLAPLNELELGCGLGPED